MEERLGERARKGRGAVSNETGRFEPERRIRTDDGWGGADEAPMPLDTVYAKDTARTIITRNDSPDVPFERSVNPYRGCEHGCIYCFARPTHAYLGLSPGLDFESRIFIKEDAPQLLAAELAKAGYQCKSITVGANTDPYQPIERKITLTRRILSVLRDFNHPLCLITKSALVQRDIDILAPMAERRLAAVAISLTTLDRNLARRLEPRAATPERRLETMAALSAAGIPVAVLASPMIPALNDAELEHILEAASQAGASSAGYILLRLPLEIAPLFEEWLGTHAPDKARHVMSLIRQSRGGKNYQSEFGRRMRGTGPYAEMLRLRFERAIRRFGLERGRAWQLDTTSFRRPPQKGDQLSLL
ncbi:MAG TPA: PA0069 family radical SAM protein [Stellaceae bacterium]|nr:PA0069 family radical SAM protein [Stellaceae bacterium]